MLTRQGGASAAARDGADEMQVDDAQEEASAAEKDAQEAAEGRPQVLSLLALLVHT
jgi:hypothetical protein